MIVPAAVYSRLVALAHLFAPQHKDILYTKLLLQVPIIAIALMPAVSLAETMNDEINYLINSVGRSGCAFVRNGETYSGKEARQHLRSKRKLNAHLIRSAEDFIEKIASRSSMSGKPYLISCCGREYQTANEWFTVMLAEYRGNEV